MHKPDFRFKQFAIWHDQCAMKVNTDGILLGAWSRLYPSSNIIDIGTGTGLIALMLAQRSQSLLKKPHIDAIELDSAAVNQASNNIDNSPWSAQVKVIHSDICQFSESKSNQQKYQILVSNPPYFSNALLTPNQQRNRARHNNELSFEQLLKSAQLLAYNQAEFNLILPVDEAKRLVSLAEQFNWFLQSETLVSTVTNKAPTRVLLRLVNHRPDHTFTDHLTIRDAVNKYTNEYINLCQNFYLAM